MRAATVNPAAFKSPSSILISITFSVGLFLGSQPERWGKEEIIAIAIALGLIYCFLVLYRRL